jgi:hypothetical protein
VTRSYTLAFGAVIYEMTTAKKAFEGKTSASVTAKILESMIDKAISRWYAKSRYAQALFR